MLSRLESNFSPFFHNNFNNFFQLKGSNYIVICEIWLFELCFPQYTAYVEVRISRSVEEGPFDFEITRADCIFHKQNVIRSKKDKETIYGKSLCFQQRLIVTTFGESGYIFDNKI